jgi:hypothetical protein
MAWLGVGCMQHASFGVQKGGCVQQQADALLSDYILAHFEGKRYYEFRRQLNVSITRNRMTRLARILAPKSFSFNAHTQI